MNRIKVILADDHEILRRSLSASLRVHTDIEVIGEAADGGELVALCREQPPDVAVVDIRMPVMDGIEASKVLKRELPQVKILILTTFDDDEYLRELFKLGIDGYLLKSSEDIILANAVTSVYLGINTLDRGIIQKLGILLSPEWQVENILTEMEEKVARLITQGHYNKDIARELDISYGRARNVVSDIYRKLGVTERSEIMNMLPGGQDNVTKD